MLKVSPIHSKRDINNYAKAINVGLQVVGDIAPKTAEGGILLKDIKPVINKYLPKVEVLAVKAEETTKGLKTELGSFDMDFALQKNGYYSTKHKMYLPELLELKESKEVIDFFTTIGHESTHGALEHITKRFEKFLNKYKNIYDTDSFIDLSELWIQFEAISRGELFSPKFSKLKNYKLKNINDNVLFKFMKIKNFDEFNTKVKEQLFDISKPAAYEQEDLKTVFEMFKAQSVDEMVAYDTTERITAGFLDIPQSIYSLHTKFYENLAKAFHV